MVGDKIGDRAVLLQLIRFFLLKVWISTGLHCIYEGKSLNNRNFRITFLQEYLQKLFVSYFST